MVKVLNCTNEEEAIVDRLQHDTSTRNHLVPCEIIRSDRTFLVMPYVPRVDQPIRREKDPLKRLYVLLKVFHQIAEVCAVHTSSIATGLDPVNRESNTCIVSALHISYAQSRAS